MTRSTSRTLRSWLSSTLHGEGRDDAHSRREQRKGWTVTIHDLSGSPVAAALMVTPFVPSPGSGRVSRANPGSWLILQATGAAPSSRKPWARLEAWRERGPVDALGYRLELVFDSGPHECAVPIAESSISTKRGGQFVIDPATFPEATAGAAWPFAGGFVMGSTVECEGRASRCCARTRTSGGSTSARAGAVAAARASAGGQPRRHGCSDGNSTRSKADAAQHGCSDGNDARSAHSPRRRSDADDGARPDGNHRFLPNAK